MVAVNRMVHLIALYAWVKPYQYWTHGVENVLHWSQLHVHKQPSLLKQRKTQDICFLNNFIKDTRKIRSYDLR